MLRQTIFLGHADATSPPALLGYSVWFVSKLQFIVAPQISRMAEEGGSEDVTTKHTGR